MMTELSYFSNSFIYRNRIRKRKHVRQIDMSVCRTQLFLLFFLLIRSTTKTWSVKYREMQKKSANHYSSMSQAKLN